MAYQMIDGKKISAEISEELKHEVQTLQGEGITPQLAVILVGDNAASKVYVKNKQKACEYIGISSLSFALPADTKEEQLLSLIDKLNEDVSVSGILVQLPLPEGIDEQKILLKIKPEKDVDCFHPYNVGMLHNGGGHIRPCTPWGVIQLLKRSGIEMAGKHALVIGRSNIVGKPMAALLLEENATVTVAHSKTKNLKDVCLQADIVVVAIGRAKFLTADMVKDGAVLIDVGVNRLDTGKLAGDIDYDGCKEKASFITPVPGGVGPMTIAMLMENCVSAAKRDANKN